MQIRLNNIPTLNPILSKTSFICLLFSIMAICINACDRENPCDASLCENGECVFSIDSVATTQGVAVQTSDTLTTSFRILTQEGTIVYKNKTFPLVSSLLVASNVEISKTSNIPNSTAVFSLLTFPACDCFKGWDGVRCDIPAPCELISCINGTKMEVNPDSCYCECELGYERTSCDREIREKFLGDYDVIIENCDLIQLETEIIPYAIKIEAAPNDIEKINIENLSALGTITAKVRQNHSLLINPISTNILLEMDTITSYKGSGLGMFNDTTITAIQLELEVTNIQSEIGTCNFNLELRDN